MTSWRALVVVGLATLGCGKTAEHVPPGEAYGCVGLVKGDEINCTELDADTTPEQRTAFAASCPRAARATAAS